MIGKKNCAWLLYQDVCGFIVLFKIRLENFVTIKVIVIFYHGYIFLYTTVEYLNKIDLS